MTRPQDGLKAVVEAAIARRKRNGSIYCGACGSTDRLRYEVEFDATIFGNPSQPFVSAVPICYHCDDLMLCAGSRPRSLWARFLVAIGRRRFKHVLS